MTTRHGTAVVAKRADAGPIDTTEIEALVEAAGYTVGCAVTQIRPEDRATHLGSGKVEELCERVREYTASLVVIDGELTPGQHRRLADRLPTGVRLLDRLRLVLELFESQTSDRRAQLQIELEQLTYDLARYEADPDEGWLNRLTEKGSPRYDLRDRIDYLERQLDEMTPPDEAARERRRREGFDLVTIAGYTNAGKSTLLHRLADDLDPDALGDAHPDTHTVAAVEDRLFKTLQTTTRRATLRGRPVLVTDTVGYVDELPTQLIASFSETLSEAAAADVVILLIDGVDDPATLRGKLDVSMTILEGQGVERTAIIPVINSVDRLDPEDVTERRAIVGEHLVEPVAISALTGTNVDTLVDRLIERLPTDRRTIELDPGDEAMALVSNAYERAVVHGVTYTDDAVRLDVAGRPAVLDRLEGAIADGDPATSR